MSGKVLLIVHQEHSDPGRVGQRLAQMGYELDLRRPCMGHDLPETMDDHVGTVVFGGPMSANDEHLPFIRAELDWLPLAVTSGKPYLGICLGAQLLSRAGGGTVAPHPDGLVEIGYFPVQATEHGRPLFPDEGHFLQWHREGYALPNGAARLAQGTLFAEQAFRYDDHAYGIQFHPEVTLPMMERWTIRGAERLTLPGAQSREQILAGWQRHDAAVDRWLDGFLAHWLGRGEKGHVPV